jgi:hypothetical protein
MSATLLARTRSAIKHLFVLLILSTVLGVADKVLTADEFERLSPAERDRIFQASIVRDLDDVPPEYLERVRARVEQRIAATESPSQR